MNNENEADHNHAAQDNPGPSHEDVAALAQRLWEDEGYPEGRAEAHWLEAERRLRDQAAGEEPASAPATEREQLATA